MANDIRTNLDVLRRVAILTLLSILCSIALTGGATLAVFGGDLSRTISVLEVWRFSLFIAIGVPALVCPIAAFRDILTLRDLNRARDELNRIAQTDQLTGLLNRRGFDLAACRALTVERIGNWPVAALMCDLDFFKRLNDQFGHDFGDAALRHVADVLRATIGERNAIVGRQGGEEFVVLLLGFSRDEAATMAETLREACASRPIVWNARTARITMSIGLAAIPQYDGQLSRLLRGADAALYQAKLKGRDRVACEEPYNLARTA